MMRDDQQNMSGKHHLPEANKIYLVSTYSPQSRLEIHLMSLLYPQSTQVQTFGLQLFLYPKCFQLGHGLFLVNVSTTIFTNYKISSTQLCFEIARDFPKSQLPLGAKKNVKTVAFFEHLTFTPSTGSPLDSAAWRGTRRRANDDLTFRTCKIPEMSR